MVHFRSVEADPQNKPTDDRMKYGTADFWKMFLSVSAELPRLNTHKKSTSEAMFRKQTTERERKK